MDLNIFADPDPSQNRADPTDLDPKHMFKINKYLFDHLAQDRIT